MTVPNLMQNWKKQERLTQLKVAYSILQNATKTAVALNEHPSTWDFNRQADDNYNAIQNTAKVYAEKYFIPYVKTRDNGKFYTDYNANEYRIHFMDGSVDNTRVIGAHDTYSIMLENGMLIHVYRRAQTQIGFFVDLNGLKGPNMHGNDVFLFLHRINTASVEPINGNNCTSTFISNLSPNSASSNLNGSSCAGSIINNGWQFPDDYPIKKF